MTDKNTINTNNLATNSIQPKRFIDTNVPNMMVDFGMKRCPYCGGSGWQNRPPFPSPLYDNKKVVFEQKKCSYCNGTGFINGNPINIPPLG